MKHFLLLFTLFICIQANAQEPAPEDYFITTWQVANYGTLTIPTKSGETYNYTVDWGDNVVTTGHRGDASHNYGPTGGGIYTIKISGDFPRFYNTRWNDKLLSIEQWGNIAWSSMGSAFKSCINLVINTTDNPDLTNVTDMSYMFYQATHFHGDLSGWDVSNVTNMSNMFYQTSFNQDIGSWNVSNVTDMSFMFFETPFNQDIGNWNVGNVTNMASIFSGATAFNQNLGGWDVSNVTGWHNMFERATPSTANYDALLKGWSTLNLKPIRAHNAFNAFNARYCTAEAERAIILTMWPQINNDGLNCNGGTFTCSGGITTYTGTWSNGVPSPTKKAIFAVNYNTSAGSIDACSIQINPGITVTVSESTTIKAENDIAINGELIFESTGNGNGELGKLGPMAAITGKATVQRYMTAERAYRMVSPAVTTSTSIKHNWQEGVNNTSTNFGDNQNPHSGFGTHITGSTSGANGFDATQTGNPSMFTVNVATQQFQQIDNTDSNTLTAGQSYLMMVRGDRGINMNTNNPTPRSTVLRVEGKLVWGNKRQKFVSPGNGAFVMFGNPYQSAVDINKVFATSTNVNTNHYYVYDPTIGTNGAYVTYDFALGPHIPSEVNQFLQPGQGAQMASLAAGAVILDFQETDKSPGSHTHTNATGNTMFADGMLKGQLYTQENYNNGGPVHDGFAMLFAEENDNALTPKDAVKPMNFYENLGIDHDGTYLSIERRAIPESGENFPLYTSGYQNTDYVLSMELNGLEDVAIYLDDDFDSTSTLLEQGAIAYSFTIDPTNPESKASDRFAIRVGERLNVNDNSLSGGITFYPNPMRSQLNVGNPKNLQLDSASLYDLTGRLIKIVDLKGTTSEVSLDVSALSSATYMVVIKGEAGQVSKLMVKE